MPGHRYHLAQATPATPNNTTQTLIQLATPADRWAWVMGISVSGKDTDGTKVPGLVKLLRQTSAGTGGTGVTPRPMVGISGFPASKCTAIERPSSEPTDGGEVVGGPWYVTVVGGLFILQIAFAEEIELAHSQRLGLVLTTSGPIAGVLAGLDFME